MDKIPFNLPALTGRELDYLREVLQRRRFAGNDEFTSRCRNWLKTRFDGAEALITHSCTGALEMASVLIDIQPGDEVIMPSFTFVSTANAVVLRGGVPVFVDIRADTLNIDERKIEAAITPQTKAIYVVHYAGVCANMQPILELAARSDLRVVEDAAQALLSTYQGTLAGRFGALACFSFHETKNVVSGEGGALVVNDPTLRERAFAVWQKGTNRTAFDAGLVDKYTWVDIGSSFLPSEFAAAVLLAQLEAAQDFTAARIRIWNRYHQAFETLERKGLLRRPMVPADCQHNGHLYYLLMPDPAVRDQIRATLQADGIAAVSHYVPLHSSPAGVKYGRVSGDLSLTEDLSRRVLRLPLYAELTLFDIDRVVERVERHLTDG